MANLADSGDLASIFRPRLPFTRLCRLSLCLLAHKPELTAILSAASPGDEDSGSPETVLSLAKSIYPDLRNHAHERTVGDRAALIRLVEAGGYSYPQFSHAVELFAFSVALIDGLRPLSAEVVSCR